MQPRILTVVLFAVMLLIAPFRAAADPHTDAFDEFREGLVGRLALLSESADPADAKEIKLLEKIERLLTRPSSDLVEDMKTASRIARIAKQRPLRESPLVEPFADSLNELASELIRAIHALRGRVAALPPSPKADKFRRGLDKIEARVYAALENGDPSKIAKTLAEGAGAVVRSAKKVAKAERSGSSGRSFVTADQDGNAFASDSLDFAYGAGGSLSLFAFDTDPTNEFLFTEINLGLTGISGPGTYPITGTGPNRAYFARVFPQCAFSCPRWDSVSGTVTITLDDAAARVVDGTFSFTATIVSGSGAPTTSVSNGRFHLRYTPDGGPAKMTSR